MLDQITGGFSGKLKLEAQPRASLCTAHAPWGILVGQRALVLPATALSMGPFLWGEHDTGSFPKLATSTSQRRLSDGFSTHFYEPSTWM